MKKAPFIIILLAALLTFFVARAHRGAGGMMSENTGYAPPAMALPLLEPEGSKFTTADWQGKAYAVNFFGSWCPDCRAEHETLRSLAGAGVVIVGIAVNDNERALHEFLDRKGNPYATVALDQGGGASHAWGITGVPETFIIDKAGIIRFHYIGPMSQSVAARDFLPVWNKITQ
jgi:cytochrome c biogenesis protein CcmG/thiol:disulfide interchange protein DsbE